LVSIRMHVDRPRGAALGLFGWCCDGWTAGPIEECRDLRGEAMAIAQRDPPEVDPLLRGKIDGVADPEVALEVIDEASVGRASLPGACGKRVEELYFSG